MAAYNQVDTPVRIQLGGKFLVILESDMGQQDGQVDVNRLVRHADTSNLLSSVLDADQGADKFLITSIFQHILSQDADEHYLHPVDLDDPVGVEQPGVVAGQEHVGVDDREFGALLQEQEVGEAVINFVVAQGDHIGGQQVHDLDGGYASVFLIDKGAFEHVAGDGVKHVLFLSAGLGDISGKHRDASGQLIVNLLGQKIAV